MQFQLHYFFNRIIYMEVSMLKYLIAWLLGVPIGILILIWLVSHVF